MGLFWAIPTSKEAKATTLKVFLEPKVNIQNNFTVGLRYELGGTDSGIDPASIKVELASLLSGLELIPLPLFSVQNYVSQVSGYQLTGDFFILDDKIISFGGGVGVFSREDRIYFQRKSYTIDFRDIKNWPEGSVSYTNNFGFSLRAGYNLGIIRSALIYNFTGKDIPNYFCLQTSLEFEFIKKRL